MVRYRVDPGRSTVGFTLRATLHDVNGTGGRVTGEFSRAAEPGEGGYALRGEVRIGAGSLVTGNTRRDAKMHKDTLAVREYASITFRPHRVLTGDTPGGEIRPGRAFEMILEGDLTIRETTRAVSIPVTVNMMEDGRLSVDGRVRLDFTDYGVPDPSFFLLRVKKELTVTFHLEADTE
jgi:polyisoprenoid-binding protein YceI